MTKKEDKNVSAFGKYTNELDKANKEFGKLASSQDNMGIAVAGGIVSAVADIGIGIFKGSRYCERCHRFWYVLDFGAVWRNYRKTNQ